MSTLQPLNPDINLDVIRAPAVVSAKRTDSFDREVQELEKDRKKLLNLELKQKIGARQAYTLAIFGLATAWIIGIYLLLVFEGFAFHCFHLDNSVLLAAIGSTTANVIALLFIIVKFLFTEK